MIVHSPDESPHCTNHNFIHRRISRSAAQTRVVHRIHSPYYDDGKYKDRNPSRSHVHPWVWKNAHRGRIRLTNERPPNVKFRIDRDTLADAVGWTARSLPTRPSVPVLTGLLLETVGDELHLSGFDYDTSTRATLPAEVSDEGKAL